MRLRLGNKMRASVLIVTMEIAAAKRGQSAGGSELFDLLTPCIAIELRPET